MRPGQRGEGEDRAAGNRSFSLVPFFRRGAPEEEEAVLGEEWTAKIVGASAASWWRRIGSGPREVLRVLGAISPGEEPCAQIVYSRVIRAQAGRNGNGFHDFEGPLRDLVREGLVEVVGGRRAARGEVSPSSVGGGTSALRRGDPATWQVRLTPLGEEVRAWWQGRSPYTGEISPADFLRKSAEVPNLEG